MGQNVPNYEQNLQGFTQFEQVPFPFDDLGQSSAKLAKHLGLSYINI